VSRCKVFGQLPCYGVCAGRCARVLKQHSTHSFRTTTNDCFCDGNAADGGAILQSGVSPQIAAEAGTFSTVQSLTLSTYGILQAVFNGASSVFQIDDQTEVTGNFGAGTPNGFHLASYGDGAQLFANIRIKEMVVYSAAHNAATRTTIKTGRLNSVRDTA
jgi:hypothetical protein